MYTIDVTQTVQIISQFSAVLFEEGEDLHSITILFQIPMIDPWRTAFYSALLYLILYFSEVRGLSDISILMQVMQYNVGLFRPPTIHLYSHFAFTPEESVH